MNHICDIWSPEVSSTCTSTPPPPPKQAASEEKLSVKRAHASSSSWKQRLHWVCPVFSPSWRLVLSKSLVQTSTKCQRSHQEEASRLWFLDLLLCLKWFIWTDYRNAFIYHGETLHFYHSCTLQAILETSPFKFTGLLQDDTLCVHPLHQCVCLPLTTDFISRLWFKSRWILLTRSRSDRARRRLAGGR